MARLPHIQAEQAPSRLCVQLSSFSSAQPGQLLGVFLSVQAEHLESGRVTLCPSSESADSESLSVKRGEVTGYIGR